MWRNNEGRSCNHCCSGKAVIVTYSECVSVALGIQHEITHAPYCYLWPAWLYNIFTHYIINGTIFLNLLLTLMSIGPCIILIVE